MRSRSHTEGAVQVSAPNTVLFNLDTVAPLNTLDAPSNLTVAGVPTVIQGKAPPRMRAGGSVRRVTRTASHPPRTIPPAP